MSYAMAPANGSDERRDEGNDQRRARARRNALLLGLLAAGFYVGFILLGALKGIFPG
jgi:hypothetical protein